MNSNSSKSDGIESRIRLGMVVSGSLTDGLEIKLDSQTSLEGIKVGTFVSVQGKETRFFALRGFSSGIV